MKKILVADDSEFMRKILIDIIKQSNWKDAEVIQASNGVEAIEKFGTDKPDLILLDILMPEKDGIAVLKEIGSLAASVVIVSAVGQQEVIDQATSLGAKNYIVKPFDAKQVIETLNALAS